MAASLGILSSQPLSSACTCSPMEHKTRRRRSSSPNLHRYHRCPIVVASTNCKDDGGGPSCDWVASPSATPYQILGVDPTNCNPDQIKAAFRARVKEFHPDVCRDTTDSDANMRRIIQAYEMLSSNYSADSCQRSYTNDPFEEPECEADDLFVNEMLCIGKGCPYACVSRAPHAFTFTSELNKARAVFQGHGEDYLIQLAVGQCPRRCIHYVTPAQRAILEDQLNSILNAPYDPAEVAFLNELILNAESVNKRYQSFKREPKISTEYVDWS